MAKKKSSSFVRKQVLAATCEGETTIFLNEPGEDNVHAGEEVVVVDNPLTTPSTSVEIEDARRELELDRCTISPYAGKPVAIDCGPGLATYWVPEYLLRSPRWPTTDAEGTLCLPGVSAATGHTLVHYLYTGRYQALGAKGKEAASPAHMGFEHALLTFVLASAYELSDLGRLAKEQITKFGSCMALEEVMNTVRNEFPKMALSWFHDYLQARAKEQFDVDHTFFTSGAYRKSVGEGALHTFMTRHLLETFSENLTLTLQGRENHSLIKEIPDAALSGVERAAEQTRYCSHDHGRHHTGVCTASDEASFEFLNASCEDVDAVISLDSSAWHKTTPTHSEPPPVPSPGPEPPAESEPEPIIEPKLKLSKKETTTEKRVRERRERKEREERERLEQEAADKEEEERLAREADEAAAADQARIEAEEAEAALIAAEEEALRHAEEEERLAQEADEAAAADQARIEAEEAEAALIAAEEEDARLAEEEAERRRKEQGSLESMRWAASIRYPSKKKESLKERKAREKREREAREEADQLAAEEQARIEAEEAEAEAARIAEEEAEAARIAEEEAEQSCPRRSSHLLESDLWKSCERCRAMLTKMALQLAKENKIV
ncbi:hypothetical protein BKA63DRAFT_598668 [Paraphoma chrysanthemicola]|nr:hypothetical protein BKA63DRAFT_598668 [Paraphoma chrysanthemicola]